MKEQVTHRRWFARSLLAAVLGPALFAGCATKVTTPRIMFADARINGQPTRLAMDSGAATNWIFSSEADRLGVKAVPMPMNAASPRRGVSDPVRIEAAGQVIEAPIDTITLPWLARLTTRSLWGGDIVGAIGWPALRDNILVFDAERRMASRIEELPAEMADWTRLKIRRGAQLFVEIPFPNGMTHTFIVDTGCPCGVILPPDLWQGWKAANPDVSIKSTYGWTLAEKQMQRGERAMAEELQLGPLRFTNLPVGGEIKAEERRVTGQVVTALKAKYPYDESGREGMIGLFALERMDFIVDGKGGFAYLRPKPAAIGGGPAIHLPWLVAEGVRLNAIPQLAYAAEISGSLKDQKGDHDGAIAEFSRALELDPNNALLYTRRAGARKSKGDQNGAIADATHALEIDPKVRAAYLIRGNAFLNKGASDRALDDFDRALELDSKDSGVFAVRGFARLTENDFVGAAAEADRAIVLDSSLAPAFHLRGLAAGFQGDFAAAVLNFDRAIKLDSKNASLYAARGAAKAELGDRMGAASDTRRAVRLDPKISAAFFPKAIELEAAALQAGNSAQLRGNYTAALAEYENVIALKREAAVDAALYRQLLLRRLGRPVEDFSRVAAGWKDSWKKTLAGFLGGSVTEPTLLAEIPKENQRELPTLECEAFYYIGMMRLLGGDKNGARESWQKSLGKKYENAPAYQLTLGELRRLADAAKDNNRN
jgi:tetratricopeptide (TPR) repeat protein